MWGQVDALGIPLVSWGKASQEVRKADLTGNSPEAREDQTV